MTLIVDPRVGSGELGRSFAKFSIPVEEEHLNFGDFAFVGCGPSGDVSIGIERKAIADFLTCMNDSRFVGHQLPGLLNDYHYTVMILEGIYRPDIEGFIETAVPSPRRDDISFWRRVKHGSKYVLFSQLSAHLNTLRLKAGTPNAGFLVMQTADQLHTVHEIAQLYRWFQKPWEEHRSHIGFYDPVSMFRASSSFERRCFMQLDGIGFERSGVIEAKFAGVNGISTLEQAMAATEKDWASIDGIGKLSAEKIFRQLHGRNEPKEPKKTRRKKDAVL